MRWLVRVSLVSALVLPTLPALPPLSVAAEGPTSAPVADRETSRVTLGRFVTTYAHDAEHRGRAFNVELAAQAIDGRAIGAGGTFSFNDAVGERTASFGFARSVVLRDGMLAEGAGGGACQVASTLHAAALLAGLDVVARAPHSRPSAYIRMGLDATVALGPAPIDLRLKNASPSPVRVRARAHRGSLEVWVEGQGPAPAVSISSEIVGRMAYPRAIERDRHVPENVVKLISYGVPGYRVRRVREVRRADGTVRRDVREDVYAPVPEVVRVAPSFDASRLERLDRSGDALHATAPDEAPPVALVVEPSATRPALVQLRPSTLVTLANEASPPPVEPRSP